jgi:hypothetical protein
MIRGFGRRLAISSVTTWRPSFLWHPQIQDQNIRLILIVQLAGLRAIDRYSNDFDIFLRSKDGNHALPNYGMIICDQNSNQIGGERFHSTKLLNNN